MEKQALAVREQQWYQTITTAKQSGQSIKSCCAENGEPSRILPIWAVSSEAFLVYIAAILFYKPIFTQPLGFIFCAASTVE